MKAASQWVVQSHYEAVCALLHGLFLKNFARQGYVIVGTKSCGYYKKKYFDLTLQDSLESVQNLKFDALKIELNIM